MKDMNYDKLDELKRLNSVDWDFINANTTYLTHGLHPYPAKFIPQIPNTLIQELSNPGDTVADIFCGSGTTLVEALLLGRNAIGVDANPIACLISEAKTAYLSDRDAEDLFLLAKRAENLANSISIKANTSLFSLEPFTSSAYRPSDKAISFWFEPFVVEELAEALSWCQILETKASCKVALTAFSSIVVSVSKQDSETRYVRRNKKILPGDTLRKFARSLTEATRAVLEFTKTVNFKSSCQVYQSNLLDRPHIGDLDLVVCSPPYPNAYSYHLYHMTRMVWLGMNQVTFKRQEIGSHRKYSSNSKKAATIETFRSEMKVIFDWLYEHLKVDKYACFVMGNSIIRGEKVNNADLLTEIAVESGFSKISRISRKILSTRKAFNPAIGKIKEEQILIFKKPHKSSNLITLNCHIKPYIKPFERKLALEELSKLVDSQPNAIPSLNVENLDFEVTTSIPAIELAKKLAYWEYINSPEKTYVCTQMKREMSVEIARSKISLEELTNMADTQTNSFPNRRLLRYGTHGLHEYRGKFFPQLVRALINVTSTPSKAIVADPMSGSGTTVVESVVAGHHGIGLDMNPLSVLIGNTKSSLLAVEPKLLIDAYQKVYSHLTELDITSESKKLSYLSTLPISDQNYLYNWFSTEVLIELEHITKIFYTPTIKPVQNLLKISLSNILRSVSWQKKDDLRVRREVKVCSSINPIKQFLEELERSVRAIIAFNTQTDASELGTFNIQEGDACKIVEIWCQYLGEVDVVITSPPYATALPYLDTDRLSLSYLGLLPRSEYRKRDLRMIGNREVTEKQRQCYWNLFQDKKNSLPHSVTVLIEKIENLNSKKAVGFRRRNLPALLAKYFLDMKEVLKGIYQLLKPGGSAFVIIGNNHTLAGDERVEIETANLLIAIAEDVGLESKEHINMDMLVPRDIFRRNAVASEVILSFQRPPLFI